MQDLRDADGGAVGPVGLADGGEVQPCGDGGDRRLLEAGVEHLERGRFRSDRGERPLTSRMSPAERRTSTTPTWIADLPACGLVCGSFVPSEKFQELRALQRMREQTRHVQRLQQTLEEANIELDFVISDIMGLSGRRMIEAIIARKKGAWPANSSSSLIRPIAASSGR